VSREEEEDKYGQCFRWVYREEEEEEEKYRQC
jgi:hypothetical protein